MPAFPDEEPPEGWNVSVTLHTGATIVAYWQGGQWWAGLDDNPHDVPISNAHVASWELLT